MVSWGLRIILNFKFAPILCGGQKAAGERNQLIEDCY
jgi:hypothetical protein